MAATTASRYLVISADCHAAPPIEGYTEHLDPEYRADAAAAAQKMREMMARLLEGPDAMFHPTAEAREIITTQHNGHPGLWDPAQRIRDLDDDGIAGEVIFPNGPIPFSQLFGGRDRQVGLEYRLAGVRARNRWLSEFCAAHPGRHAGIALVPIDDVDAAVDEVRWASAHGLFGGVNLPAIDYYAAFPPYNNPVYEPLWSVCEELDMPLNVHLGGTPYKGEFYGGGPQGHCIVESEQHFFGQRPIWFLIFSGVFERHPRLKLVVTETMAYWAARLPSFLDSIYEQPMIDGIREVLPRRPSEYWAENCYLGASFLARCEADERDAIGVDRIMWGSDYPHLEGTWPNTQASLRKTMAGLPTDDVRRMVGENALDCFRFDREALRAVANDIGPRPEDLDVPLDAVPDNAQARLGHAFREVAWS